MMLSFLASPAPGQVFVAVEEAEPISGAGSGKIPDHGVLNWLNTVKLVRRLILVTAQLTIAGHHFGPRVMRDRLAQGSPSQAESLREGAKRECCDHRSVELIPPRSLSTRTQDEDQDFKFALKC